MIEGVDPGEGLAERRGRRAVHDQALASSERLAGLIEALLAAAGDRHLQA